VPPFSHLSNPHLVHPRPSIRLFAARNTATTTANRPYQLVIVESPSKCKTISSILQKYVSDHHLEYDYLVESSMGHVRNLPKSEKGATVVGVDVHHNYQPTYTILPGKKGLVKNLISLAEGAQKVVLATDEDREGEAVAWHLTQVLGQDKEYERVVFNEITTKAIEKAIQHPTTLNENLVQAQETRRILDRLAGYTLSPILWKKIAPGLSAGRVQSVGMALIVARERERLVFKAVSYNDMTAEFFLGDLIATLVAVNGVPVATGNDFNNSGTLLSSNKRHYTSTDIEELKNSLMGGPDGDP
jgi:DNA topoisomerase-1